MVDLFLYSALSFGGVAGAIGGMEIISWRNRKRISTQIKKRVGCESFLSARSIFVESRGLNYWIIQKMVLFSDDHVNLIKGTSLFPWALGLNNKETLIQKSGLLGIVNEKGIFSIRLTLSFFGFIVGLFAGALFSDILALLLAVLLFFFGFLLPTRALKSESQLRSQCVERQLAQMIEVIILGLQSGLSFDRSAKLYTAYFEGTLKESFSRAQSQWEHGLLIRSEALKSLAETYDSSLFFRAIESINRSLRFGSSLSESLSLIASEARSVRKTTLEERIAKAPVKMLLPVGTLILPAMLILIMGPILLDLMNGM